MKRRNFLKTISAAGLAGATPVLQTAVAAPVSKNTPREFYELRAYTLKDQAQRKLVEDYLGQAFIPALNRLGHRPVGVFAEQKPSENPLLYVLIPATSPDQLTQVGERVLADKAHQQAGGAYLAVEAPAAAYLRIDSSLLIAFEGMPKLELPNERKSSRIFQLRVYESHSETAGKKKVEMFNRGEIGIFKRVGLTPVFFGETLIGLRRPNLTYLLVFDDQAALDKAWATFRPDPEWLKLKAIPEYADQRIVSKITNTVLVPAACSQM